MEGLEFLACISLIFLCISPPISTFNVDITVPIVKEGDPFSYFGYSVAQHHVFRQSQPGESVILVGAPKGNISHPRARNEDRDLVRPGVIYSCPVTSRTQDCTELLIDEPGDSYDKNDKWLGVSIASQGTEEGKAVACAHRYKNADSGGAGYNWGPGICTVMQNSLDEESFLEPCYGKDVSTGHGAYGFCQAGTSIDVNEDGDVLVGVPGPYNWRGSVFKNIIRDSLQEQPTWYNSPVETPPKKDPTSVPTPIPLASYSYMGMSSCIGNLINGEKTYIAGAPRAGGAGQVMLFLQGGTDNNYLEMEPNHILTGDQFGSNFGYATAVLDVNNDRKDDLVVSAPFYHGEGVGGAVFLFLNGPDGITSDSKPMMIVSPKMSQKECDELMCLNSKFGLSIASLGDIDLDGYDDLAVGAPFEGDGAVYIYRGSPTGLEAEYSQRLRSKELLLARPMSSFGSSLRGGMDMDGNGYPDLVVGAYESNKALILRSRPVIHVMSHYEVTPDKIDPQLTQCPYDGKSSNCFKLKICFKFTAKPENRFTNKIRMNYRVEADTFTGRKVARVTFKGSEKENPHIIEQAIELNEQTSEDPSCDVHLVYLIKQNRDFLHPIQMRLTYELEDMAPPVMIPGGSLPDINNYPVLNQKKAVVNIPVDFRKNCGTDDACQSQLVLRANMPKVDKDKHDNYILKVGSIKDGITLQARIRNDGEDAHEASLSFTLPEKLYFVSAVKDGVKISCPEIDNIRTCPVGNPMGMDEKTTISIKLDPSSILSDDKILEISMRVNTTSLETDPSDDAQRLTLKVVVETDLEVSGHSHPSEIPFGGEVIGESAVKFEDQIGLIVNHTYVVSNGPGTVSNVTVHISWPYEVENNYPQGKHLLYLLEAPVITAPGRCYLDPDKINTLDVQVDPKYRIQMTSRSRKRQRQQRPQTQSPAAVTSPEEEPAAGAAKSRRKRENVIQSESIKNKETGKYETVVTLDCDRGTARCFTFPCVITPMTPNDRINIQLRARLWNSTFLEDYRDVDHVRIRSKARIEIDPRLNIRQNNTQNDVAYIETKAVPDIAVKEPPGVPLWVIIVAAVAGVLLLILLVVLLWKCGFFKRKRAGDIPDHKGTLQKKKKGKNSYHEDPYN